MKEMEVVNKLEEDDEILKAECTLDFEYEIGDNIEVMEEKTVNKLIIK
jgi:hypothetical protein